MTTIAPIPTTYRGYRFRSRLEARWAVFLDALGLPFEYELQGYQTSAGWYLPDFWLPTLKMFGEVKPHEPSREALAKVAAVAHGTQFPFVMLVGTPDEKLYQFVTPTGRPPCTWSFGSGVMKVYPEWDRREYCARYRRAVLAARGARFGT